MGEEADVPLGAEEEVKVGCCGVAKDTVHVRACVHEREN